MAVELEVPVGVRRKPVVRSAVENDESVVANAEPLHKSGECFRADEVTPERILQVVLPVNSRRAGHVAAAVGISVLVHVEKPNVLAAEVRFHPLGFDEHLPICRDRHCFKPPIWP